MSNTYKPVSEWAKARYEGDVVELDLSATDEADMLGNGHMELVPRKYKVLSRNFFGADSGDEVEGAYPVDVENALVNGGHLERVEPKKTAKKTTAKKSGDD